MTDEVPWEFAGRIAGLVSGEHPLAESYLVDHLAAELPAVVAAANDMVSEATNLDLPGAPDVVVATRREWVDRNIGAFARMLEPAEKAIAGKIEDDEDGPGPALARRMVAVETGALMGFMAKRVLGQYELVLPTGDDGDSVTFVGGNILEMERTHQLLPHEFRFWIALHEAAHRAQFVGVPWMRDYFLALVEEMVSSAVTPADRIRSLVDRVMETRRTGAPILDERGLLGLVATDEQRATLDRIQALMSLLEGHGHVVMDRLGEATLLSQPRMAAILKGRRADPKTKAFFRITGLEMKIKQYAAGETFVRGVEAAASWDTLACAWQEPDALPTLAEIEEPKRWLARVA